MNCGSYNANTKVHVDRWLPGLVVGCKPSGGGCSSLMSLTPLTGDPFFFPLPEILFVFTLLDSVHLLMHFSPASPQFY